MKTLFAMEFYGAGPLIFFELEGDYRHFNGININEGEDPQNIEDELYDLVYKEGGELIITPLKEPTKDWDYFVKVGFLP
jgi:hypothetical protein